MITTVTYSSSKSFCQDVPIQDLRSTQEVEKSDLRDQIVAGLKRSCPVLPSLLIWDDSGSKFFDELIKVPGYRPFHEEMAILTQYADEMVKKVPPGGILVELGCGNLVKTRILLSAFERQRRRVSYYALDISQGELTNGLHQLMDIFGHSEYVQVRGLLGSYEDGMQWLAGIHTSTKVVTILWVGNSMANYSRRDAALLLKGFVRSCDSQGLLCQFLLGLDSCRDLAKMTASYDFYPGSPSENLIVNGLRAANACLGQEIFSLRNWTARASYDLLEHTLGLYYVATRDQHIVLDGYSREFRAGDRILAITSGKWLIKEIVDMCASAGLRVSQTWWSDAQDYAFHAVQPQL